MWLGFIQHIKIGQTFHEGFPLRWKDQGFQAGTCVIFPNGALPASAGASTGASAGAVAGASAGGQARSPWRLDDRDPALPDFPSDDIHSHVLSFQVHFFYILFSPSVASFWHTDGGWPEKTWENITRVFTRGEKAGQTNHLNLYCSTFLCQTVNLFSTCFNAVLWVLVFLLRAFRVIK